MLALWGRRSRVRLATMGRGFWIAVGVIAAAAGAVAVLGGFAPAHREEAPLAQLEPGEAHVNKQLSATVLSAELTDDPDLFLGDDEQALIVRLELVNPWTQPLSPEDAISEVMAFDPVPEQRPDRATRADGGPLGWLQPGVVTPATLRWDVPAGSVDPGSTLHVTFSDGRLRQLEVLGDEWTWDDHSPVAELDVPVDDRTGMTE